MPHQKFIGVLNGNFISKTFPSPNTELIAGIRWGRCDQIFSPAYWAAQAWLVEQRGRAPDYRLGCTLTEEIVACVLGGYGIPAEVGIAAFLHLKEMGILTQTNVDVKVIHELLSVPLDCGTKQLKYRFAAQKSKYISHILRSQPETMAPQHSDLKLREWLLELPGIGPKTSAWITRNWLSSNNVAIIDIHIFRACCIVGLFSPKEHVQSAYFNLESRFLRFCEALEVEASLLDDFLWKSMRLSGRGNHDIHF